MSLGEKTEKIKETVLNILRMGRTRFFFFFFFFFFLLSFHKNVWSETHMTNAKVGQRTRCRVRRKIDDASSASSATWAGRLHRQNAGGGLQCSRFLFCPADADMRGSFFFPSFFQVGFGVSPWQAKVAILLKAPGLQLGGICLNSIHERPHRANLQMCDLPFAFSHTLSWNLRGGLWGGAIPG